MKVLPFTILYPDNKSVIAEQIEQPHFYQFLHRHEECQLTFIERGSGILIAGNNMHAFQAGDVFLIGGNLPHLFKSNPEYFKPRSPRTIKATSLYFNVNGTMGGLFNLPEMKAVTAFLQTSKHGFKVAAAHRAAVVSGIRAVHQASGLNALQRFLELLTTLHTLKDSMPLCPVDYSTDISESEGIRLSRIMSFIMQRYNTAISLDEVAAVAFMTPPAFCRYFKRHTGRKFVNFLNEVRINEACKNLTRPGKPDGIADAAYNAGFNNITNFNRVFKSIKGHSPREYIAKYNTVNGV